MEIMMVPDNCHSLRLLHQIFYISQSHLQLALQSFDALLQSLLLLPLFQLQISGKPRCTYL